MFYSIVITWLLNFFPSYQLSVAPFEYSGVVLGLLLVARVNAGMDRWWEARKIWGNIVNQCRNLSITGYQYSEQNESTRKHFLKWVALLPHTLRGHLRSEKETKVYEKLIGKQEAEKISDSNHMPMYVSYKISEALKLMRRKGLDNFAYQRADEARAQLIDAIGACERILTTPIPLALAIKTRRFIFFFLFLLPFGVVPEAGLLTPFVMLLTSYPLLSLDEIGVSLQSPFEKENLSHLPLNSISKRIEEVILEIPEYSNNQNPHFSSVTKS